jgi:hypothetical protein
MEFGEGSDLRHQEKVVGGAAFGRAAKVLQGAQDRLCKGVAARPVVECPVGNEPVVALQTDAAIGRRHLAEAADVGVVVVLRDANVCDPAVVQRLQEGRKYHGVARFEQCTRSKLKYASCST